MRIQTLAVIASLLIVPAVTTAQQNHITLVNNWRHRYDLRLARSNGLKSYGQEFTTGANPGGYMLSQLAVNTTSTGPHSQTRAQICPQDEPPAWDGPNSGCTPRDTQLEAGGRAIRYPNWTDYFMLPETTYMVILEQSNNGGTQGTNNNNEAVAQPGWTIADQVLRWNNGTWEPVGIASLKMEVFGHINHRATGEPEIAGTPTAGTTVRATAGTIADQNGLGSPSYTWTWMYPDGTIRGTGSELVLEDRDNGKQLIVNGVFKDAINAPEERTSNAWPANGTITPSTASARLETLSLSQGTLSPAFVGSHTGYSARVDSGATRITVTATASHEDSTLEYLTGDDSALQDADTAATGFQVDLASAATVFQVRVTTAITNLTKTYRVTVHRNEARCGAPEAREIWCATLTVGRKSSLRGYSENLRYGTLSPTRFTHRGLTGRVAYLAYQGSTLDFQTEVASNEIPRHGFYGNEDYVLELGSGTSKKSFTITRPGESNSFAFTNHGLTWREGQQVLVRLKNAAVQAVAPYITKPPELGTLGGADGGDLWTPGSRVTIDVTFSAPVEVSTGSGRRIPSIGIELGGQKANARTAQYVEGRRTNVLRFWYTITDRDGSQNSVKVVPDSLATNRGAIIANEAPHVDALLSHDGAFKHAGSTSEQTAVDPPTIDGAPEIAGAGADGTWRDGEDASVTLTFTEPVTVDTTNGTPSVEIQLSGIEARSGSYTSGTGTASLTFTYTLVSGDGSHTTMAVAPDSLGLNGGTIQSVETDANAELGHQGRLAIGTPRRSTPPNVRFENVPTEHDGETAFNLSVAFGGEPDGLSAKRDPASVLEVAGGEVNNGSQTGTGQNTEWAITITPSGADEVTIAIPARACTESNAVCIDGQALEAAVTATVQGPPVPEPEPVTPITATWSSVPGEHDGTSTFDAHLDFSQPPANFSYRAITGGIVNVENGQVNRVWRRVKGKNDQWGLEIRPTDSGNVTLRVNGTTDCDAQHAACTADGGMLEGGAQAVVAGPALLSVADAEVDENDGATLDFVVTLSRRRSNKTTVDYRTTDGSATAGQDYTGTAGTLTFTPGETTKTISVTVLDDAHDDSQETLTLRLSNPAGATVGDGEATGTITNQDPLPRALLARFGRTAALHVIERVEERIQAPRSQGFEGRIANRRLQRGMERDLATDLVNQLGTIAGTTGSPNGNLGGPGHLPSPMLSGSAGARRGTTNPVGAPGVESGTGSWDNSMLGLGLGRESLLQNTTFAVNRESRGGILSFWNSGARSQFSSHDGPLGLNGDVRTTMVGADYAKGAMVTGLSLAHSRGLGEYSGPASGELRSSVTGLYPWIGYRATDRMTVWGVAGYGSGSLLLTPQNGSPLESELSMAMASVGTRGEIIASDTTGFTLAFKADALWVGTASDEVDGPDGRLAATNAGVQRFRTALETLRTYTSGRFSIRPSVEVGVRHDRGDAETGAGLDMGAGLVVSEASSGLSIDMRLRTLIVHQTAGYRERGFALAVSYSPTPSSPLGLSATIAPAWGGEARSGGEALWARETMSGVGHQSINSQGSRIAGDVGYGMAIGSRFVGTPRAGMLGSEHGREYRVGYDIEIRNPARTAIQIGVEGRRMQNPYGSSNGALARATVQW